MNNLEVMIEYNIPVLSEKQTPEQKALLEKYADKLPPELEKNVAKEVALAHMKVEQNNVSHMPLSVVEFGKCGYS